MRAVRITIAVAAIATASSLLAIPPAGAHGNGQGGGAKPPTPTVLTTAVGAPFNLEVDRSRLLVADGGPGIVGVVERNGTVTHVADSVGASGVATSGGYLAYTTTTGGQEGITASGVTITGPKGFTASADTLAHETEHNPDGKLHYGVKNPSQCVRDTLTEAGFPVSYTGALDSHAYSLTAWRHGFVVADAGANALFYVNRKGDVSTLAVLPPQPATLSAGQVAALGLDACATGVTYAFESVPTDVEVGRDGFLYVTTLPGGPENPVLGARGKVYRVNPRNGKATQVASGLLGATNLALVDGKVYVAELFAGRISRVSRGKVTAWLDLPGVVAVEAGPRGSLYAATMGSDESHPGSVVKVTSGGHGWRH